MYKTERTKKWMLRAGAILFALLMMIQIGAYPVQASEYWPEGTEIASPNAIVMELSTGTILYEKESLEQHFPASITKIMTTLVALENSDLDEIVTFSDEAIDNTMGSGIARDYGEQMTMEQCLYAVMLESANECAYAVAEHVGGTVENFVAMMNEKAGSLGCKNTHFANPHGLQDENHYTTPYDIYLMLKEALNYPEFTEITQMPSYTVTFTHSDGSEDSVALTATDHYLTGEANVPKGVTVLGGKTGTTNSAGNCLALLSQNSYGSPYISIVMGASSKELLYQQMTSLLEKINQ